MATRVEEAYSERDEAIDAKGNVTEVEIPYLVFDVRDESEALAAVRGNHKAVSGMSLASVETVERVNGDTWKVKAVYEAEEDRGSVDDASSDEEDATVFAFDTGGGTKHLNQSIKTDGMKLSPVFSDVNGCLFWRGSGCAYKSKNYGWVYMTGMFPGYEPVEDWTVDDGESPVDATSALRLRQDAKL